MATKLALKKFSQFTECKNADLISKDDNSNGINDKLWLVGYEEKDDSQYNDNFKIKLDELTTAIRSHINFEYVLHENETAPSQGDKVTNTNPNTGFDVNKIHLFKSESNNSSLGTTYDKWIIVKKEDKYYWEPLGPSQIDLSKYLCIAEVNLGDAYSLYEASGNYQSAIIYDDKKNLRVLECVERFNDIDTVIQPEISYNSTYVCIDATVIDIFGNKTCLIGNDSSLIVKYVYNYA